MGTLTFFSLLKFDFKAEYFNRGFITCLNLNYIIYKIIVAIF